MILFGLGLDWVSALLGEAVQCCSVVLRYLHNIETPDASPQAWLSLHLHRETAFSLKTL